LRAIESGPLGQLRAYYMFNVFFKAKAQVGQDALECPKKKSTQ